MAEYICPHCKNPINDDEALLCLYCGGRLDRGVGLMGKIPRQIFIFIIVVLILSFFMLIIR
ncbi:MAG: hypothetical protein GY853_04665 [PVC group bacterium]|nr:hypothetical protein [PVC group bacterium]